MNETHTYVVQVDLGSGALVDITTTVRFSGRYMPATRDDPACYPDAHYVSATIGGAPIEQVFSAEWVGRIIEQCEAVMDSDEWCELIHEHFSAPSADYDDYLMDR